MVLPHEPAASGASAAVSFGVAIAVPEPHGTALQRRRAGFGDPQAHRIPSHVTLLPPEHGSPERVEQVTGALEEVAARTAPFTMRLEGTDTFRPVSPVVFVALAEGTHEAEQLAGAVRAATEAPAPQFPFHPHVTIAHDLPDERLDLAQSELERYACAFAVREFSLYLQDERTGWSPRVTFPLTGSCGPAAPPAR